MGDFLDNPILTSDDVYFIIVGCRYLYIRFFSVSFLQDTPTLSFVDLTLSSFLSLSSSWLNIEPKFRSDLLVALTTNHKASRRSRGRNVSHHIIMGLEDYFWNLDVTFHLGYRVSLPTYIAKAIEPSTGSHITLTGNILQ